MTVHDHKLTPRPDQDKKITSCTCTEYGYANPASNNCMDQGWESTAPLKFGSVIRIGCQTFLFTKVNHTLQPETNDSVSSHPSSISSNSTNDGKPKLLSAIPGKSPPTDALNNTNNNSNNNTNNSTNQKPVPQNTSEAGSNEDHEDPTNASTPPVLSLPGNPPPPPSFKLIDKETANQPDIS